jgi:hypothetical protein
MKTKNMRNVLANVFRLKQTPSPGRIGRGVVLFLITLSSCFVDDVHFSVTPELMPFFETFQAEAIKHSRPLPESLIIKIDQIGDIAGHAYEREGIHYVVIDSDFYTLYSSNPNRAEYNYFIIELAVFHELGHTALNLDHHNKDGIMNPYGNWHRYATDEAYRNYQLNDLFAFSD